MARKVLGEGLLASTCSPSPGWSAVHQFWGSLSCPLASWSTAIAHCLLQKPGRPLPFPNLAPETGGHIQWSWVVRLGTSQGTPDGLPGSLFGKPNHNWGGSPGEGSGKTDAMCAPWSPRAEPCTVLGRLPLGGACVSSNMCPGLIAGFCMTGGRPLVPSLHLL